MNASRGTRGAGWLMATAMLMSLSACVNPPDLSAIEASFDAPPGAQQARIPDTLARTEFGREVARAVETSPDLAASSAGVRAARARADAERRGYYPRFSLASTLGTLVDGSLSSNGLTPMLRIVQLVYDGGESASRRVAAEARVFESRRARQELAAARALNAVVAWHDLYAARARLEISLENVRAHERVLAVAQERADAGAGGNVDVLTTEARLATARARAAEAQASAERAEAAFAASFDAAPPARLAAPPESPDLPDIGDAALMATSPRILAIEARIAAAEAEVAVTRAQRLPSLSVDGRVRRSGTTATLDAELDTGAPGSQRARIAAAEAERDAIAAEREVLARDILRALADRRADQRASAVRLSSARASVSANRATVEASREEFSIGRRSLIGLLDAERDLLEANEILIATEREVALSGYAALALTGDILDAFAIRLPQEDAPPEEVTQ
ncbi:MAG: TolC family protein [Roseovarius sp.]|nr:TolC family protein [Roseovarius sp.]